MNEPKDFVSGKDMSRLSQINPEEIKKFLNKSYMDGPLKDGFAEEHRKLLLAKLCTYPAKVKEFESERDPSIIFYMIDKRDIKKVCFEFKPKTGNYPPTNPSCNAPAKASEFALLCISYIIDSMFLSLLIWLFIMGWLTSSAHPFNLTLALSMVTFALIALWGSANASVSNLNCVLFPILPCGEILQFFFQCMNLPFVKILRDCGW